ncbi:class F sortase [Streptomyces angustmyceticus]|uniref:Class F sortase n=1 Tax=Streptomyces angustmyceticus TaxID=285578 RepID=A0A5J4LLD6_9ACTN|nr:class F sortase [Streptomyces angustmyceticus]GES33314.1 class F sortase [Streptomyces angustmyceticus]
MSRRSENTVPTVRRRGHRLLGCALAAACASVLLAGCGGQDAAAPPPSLPPGQSPAPGGDTSHDGASGGGSGSRAAASMPKSVPERLSIPSLQVSSTLETLGQHTNGTMETPRDPDKAGWYRPGPTPGSRGPAVIAGHVTWNGKPSVFEKLSTMKAGDTIEVARQDGKTAKFTVDRVAQYPKNKFPTVEVYKNLDHAGLRLITCGGRYNEGRHYYPDNVVVFASLTGSA